MINAVSQKAKELVAQMTLEEKASLCSGKNFWETKAVERLGVASFVVTDGPHGLRKQAGEIRPSGSERLRTRNLLPHGSGNGMQL